MKNIVKNLKNQKHKAERVVARHLYGNPSEKLKIIAVTGTNGKTTIATLLYKIALELGYKAGLISTVNIVSNEREIKLKRSAPTTPEAMTLFKIFSDMVKDGCEYVFMEVSSHALDQGRVAGINFVGGIFTNLTLDHLDYHKSFENYFGAKKKLFDNLPQSAFALSNIDDPYGKKILDGTKAKKCLYRFKNSPSNSSGQVPDFKGEIKELNFSGLVLKVNDEEIKSKLLGEFNAYNLLAIWSTCQLLGFDMEKVKNILRNIEPPTGRVECIYSPTGILGIVDFAHSPDSLEKVLLTIGKIKQSFSKIICVFGCGGDPDPMKRKLMGKIGASLADISIFTADSPKFESEEQIVNQMKENLSQDDLKKIKVIWDRKEAIIEAMKNANKGDIILLAGKGHEDYQEIRGAKHHFNDMEELKKVFANEKL